MANDVKFELQTTVKEFTLSDESGYSFRIVNSYDPEFGGWNATITVNSRGLKDEEAAIDSLADGMERALRLIRGRAR